MPRVLQLPWQPDVPRTADMYGNDLMWWLTQLRGALYLRWSGDLRRDRVL
jgi:hypothetical protein